MALNPGTVDLTLTATNQPILTNGGMVPLIISKAVVFNTDSAAHTITVYKVSSGGSAGSGNELIASLSIPAASGSPPTVLQLSGLVLDQNDSIQGLASLTSVVNISIGFVAPT